MKKIILFIFLFVNSSLLHAVQPNNNDQTLNKTVEILQSNQVRYENNLRQLQSSIDNTNRQITALKNENAILVHQLDSMKAKCLELESIQTNDRNSLTGKIEDTDRTVSSNQSTLQSRTIWGLIIAALLLSFFAILAAIAHSMRNRIKNGALSIDEVRKAQSTLQSAQSKMQEESVKLDNRLLELLDKQVGANQPSAGNDKIDHSLVTKVADEIVRIELNMSRMDSNVKGYKQLAKAVERIKNNFMAQGYEIVDMLGKPYNDGMKAVASFVSDESLDPGKQIITGITKPQINYKGVMIQAAQITVSQNI